MYQLYGIIDGIKFNQLFNTVQDIYSEMESIADQLRNSDSFNLYIVNPEGTQIQEFMK